MSRNTRSRASVRQPHPQTKTYINYRRPTTSSPPKLPDSHAGRPSPCGVIIQARHLSAAAGNDDCVSLLNITTCQFGNERFESLFDMAKCQTRFGIHPLPILLLTCRSSTLSHSQKALMSGLRETCFPKVVHHMKRHMRSVLQKNAFWNLAFRYIDGRVPGVVLVAHLAPTIQL